MFNRFLSLFRTDTVDADNEIKLAFLSDDALDKPSDNEIKIDIEDPSNLSPITPENNGDLKIFSNEITSHIISFLDMRSMARMAQTNRHLHDVTENTFVMTNRMNKETGEKERVPAIMITSRETGIMSQATYADIRIVLFSETPIRNITKQLSTIVKTTELSMKCLMPSFLIGILCEATGLGMSYYAITSEESHDEIALPGEVLLFLGISLKVTSMISACFTDYATRNLRNQIDDLDKQLDPTIKKLL